MATLETATRTSLADDLNALVNSGTGTAQLKYETSGGGAVAEFDLQDPPFTESGGVLTLAGTPITASNVPGGTAAKASIYDKDGTKVLGMTLGTGGAEVTVGNTVIGASDTITISAGTLTINAS